MFLLVVECSGADNLGSALVLTIQDIGYIGTVSTASLRFVPLTSRLAALSICNRNKQRKYYVTF